MAVFYWLLNMSIAGSLFGSVILLLRCIRRIPRRVMIWLWGIPFLRMWLPVGLHSNYNLLSLLPDTAFRLVPMEEIPFAALNFSQAATSYEPLLYKTRLLQQVFQIAGLVWMAGAVVLLAVFCLLYISGKRDVLTAYHLRDNLYLSDKVTTPAVLGVFRPRIVLPRQCESMDLTYILMHEHCHIRRLDNLWRILAFITVSLHWFNPFAWLFLKLFLSDLELACDETVLHRCDPAQHKAYALCLLDFAESKSIFASAFGGGKLRRRIENILSYRKMSAFAALGFGVLVIAVAYVLLTN